MNSKSFTITSHNKPKNGLISKIIKRIIMIGISLTTAYILVSCGGQEAAIQQEEYVVLAQANTAEPTPIPTAVPTATAVPTVTAEPTPTEIPTPSPTPTAVPTATPEPTATPIPARNLSDGVIKFIEDSRPTGFDDLTDEEKVKVLLEYIQQIDDYSADVSNVSIIDTEDFGDRAVLSDEELELSKKVYNMIRNLAELSVDQPINGKILDKNTKMGVFKEEYLNAAKEFMLAQMQIRNGNNTYSEADTWYKYAISVMISAANKAYIPEYFYAGKESEPEVRNADYYGVYFVDMENIEVYAPYLKKNGVVYVGDINRRKYTLEQMMDFMNVDYKNYNPNILIKGIKTEADMEKEAVLKQIEIIEGFDLKQAKTKTIG